MTTAVPAVRNAVRTWLEKFEAGDKVLVAVSGGADSLALAYAMSLEAKKVAINVIGITVDHQLQASSSTQAEKVVEQLSKFGLDCVITKVDVDIKEGLEASARKARYEVLNDYAKQEKAVAVFLGHTKDDQAETVLLGLARGSGARSLSGMAVENNIFVRPLLKINRAQTVAACNEVGIEVWIDPHNSDERFARVKVRQNLLPIFEEKLGPGVTEALARTADLLRDDADALDDFANQFFAQVDPASIEIADLARLPKAIRTRVLRLAIYKAGAPSGMLTADHIAQAEALISEWHGQGEVSLPGNVKLSRNSGRITLSSGNN